MKKYRFDVPDTSYKSGLREVWIDAANKEIAADKLVEQLTTIETLRIKCFPWTSPEPSIYLTLPPTMSWDKVECVWRRVDVKVVWEVSNG